MFLVGEARAKVCHGKVQMPKEFHLREKKLIGKWKNEDTLIISDNKGSISFATGREHTYFKISVDAESRLSVSPEYEGADAIIRGNVSTIEVTLKNRKGV